MKEAYFTLNIIHGNHVTSMNGMISISDNLVELNPEKQVHVCPMRPVYLPISQFG